MDTLAVVIAAVDDMHWVKRGCFLYQRGWHFARHEFDSGSMVSIWEHRDGRQMTDKEAAILEILKELETSQAQTADYLKAIDYSPRSHEP